MQLEQGGSGGEYDEPILHIKQLLNIEQSLVLVFGYGSERHITRVSAVQSSLYPPTPNVSGYGHGHCTKPGGQCNTQLLIHPFPVGHTCAASHTGSRTGRCNTQSQALN